MPRFTFTLWKTLTQVLPIIVVAGTLLSARPANAATIESASCSYGDVADAIASASQGDTVTIPAGECVWSTKMIVTKGITLQGAGVGSTIIRDSVKTGALLRWNCAANAQHRLTGIEFRNGARTVNETNGVIVFECMNTGTTTVRIDHNKFDNLNGQILRPNTVVGVIDHNTFITTPGRTAIYIYHPNWNGTDDRWGDSSWASSLTWGSGQFLFVEDNDLTGGSCVDGYRGTRAVFRFNTFTNCHITAHGTESGGRNRGSRALEIYKNTYANNALGAERILSNVRSGSALIWGNTATGLVGGGAASQLNQYRAINAFEPFGGATGQNQWDINAANGGVFGEFKATGAALLTVKVSNAGWPANKWKGYTIRKTSACTGSCYSVVVSSTFNTISFAQPDGFRAKLSFVAGDTFKIFRVFEVFDGIGRGGGSMVTGGDWETVPSRPSGWNNQVTVPLYEWLNTNNGLDIGLGSFGSCTGTCRENEHFYNHRPAEVFDGTVGVGVGPIADRPATCEAGVWYWATDEGEWDGSNPGADGLGYVCNPANVWTLAYTPYVYPHPLNVATPANAVKTPAAKPGYLGSVTAKISSLPAAEVSHPESAAPFASRDSHSDAALSLTAERAGGAAIIGLRKDGVLATETIVPASAPVWAGSMNVENRGPVATSIAFSNPNAEDALISYRFTDASGADMGFGSLTLEAGEHVASFLSKAPFNGPSLMEGTFTFRSTVPVVAMGLRGLANERGEFLLTALPLAPSDARQRGAGLPLFADGGGWATQITLTNTSDVTASGTVRFFGQGIAMPEAPIVDVAVEEGVGSSFSYVIPPHGMARIVTTGASPIVQTGSVQIIPADGPSGTSEMPVATAILSLRRDGLTITQTGITALAAGTASHFYVESSGRVGRAASIQSGLAIANTSPESVIASIELTQPDGARMDLLPVSITLPARGQLTALLTDLFPDLPGDFQGIANVTASSGVVVAGLRGMYDERGNFLIGATPALSEAAPLWSEFVLDSIASGFGYSTQVVVPGSVGRSE